MARYRCPMLGLILLGALTSAAEAQTTPPAPAAGEPPAVHLKKSPHRKAVSTPKTPVPSSDSAERAAALARERRNFFAHDKDDASDSDPYPNGGAGGSSMYLGGSSGLTPGMQFKF